MPETPGWTVHAQKPPKPNPPAVRPQAAIPLTPLRSEQAIRYSGRTLPTPAQRTVKPPASPSPSPARPPLQRTEPSVLLSR